MGTLEKYHGAKNVCTKTLFLLYSTNVLHTKPIVLETFLTQKRGEKIE